MSSQRVAKVESMIQGIAATALWTELERDGALVSVTNVDASPDLRNATIWVGILGDEATGLRIFDRVQGIKPMVQSKLAKSMTMKYVPRIHFRHDTGGAYSAEIGHLLDTLK